MIGAFMLLIIAAASLTLMLQVDHTDGLFKAGIVYDIMFLSSPIAAFVLINKRGLDRDHLNRTADQIMLCVLLIIGVFDQSGGLLFLSMYGLVALVAIQYRHHGVTMLAPLALISTYWLGDHGIMYSLLESFDANVDQLDNVRVLWLNEVTGMILAAHMLMPIAWSIRDVQQDEHVDNPFPWFIPMIWFLFGAWAVLPSASWLPLVACSFGLLNAWVRGDINLIPLLAVGLIFSFVIGLADGRRTYWRDLRTFHALLWYHNLWPLVGKFLRHPRNERYRYGPIGSDDAVFLGYTITVPCDCNVVAVIRCCQRIGYAWWMRLGNV